MLVWRLVWYPDELDRRIVAELVARGGRLDGCVIARADLACLLEITPATLDRRIRALSRYGYVLRQRIRGNRGVRYHVVRVPDATVTLRIYRACGCEVAEPERDHACPRERR